jgi:soluble lytic murein transglycosylase
MERSGARALAGVAVAVCAIGVVAAWAGPGDLQRPLPRALGPDLGVALDPSQRAGAEALGRAVAALDAGDWEAAGAALRAAGDVSPIADYMALHRARWLLAKGDAAAAARVAAAARRDHGDSPILADLARLEGDALVRTGDEAGARAAWEAALERTSAAAERREIKLAILASRERSGEIEAGADPEQLLASAFGDAVVPGELAPGQRSAAMALRDARALAGQGRNADAIEAYREAIAGGLEGGARHEARLELGIALFSLRRYDEALRAFELLGSDVEGRYWRARTLARLGRIDQAITGFEALAGSGDSDVALRSAFLAATLLEDRGEEARAMAHYARVAADPGDGERAQDALWRIGWSAWMREDYDTARARFAELAARTADEIEALRPRYWEARSAEKTGDDRAARTGFEAIARGWPLTYYGWRAQQRLGEMDAAAAGSAPSSTGGGPTLTDADLARVALLLAAGLREDARLELGPLASRAQTRADHERVGRLLVAAGDYYQAQRLVLNGSARPLVRGVRPGDETLLWLSWPPAFGEIVEQSVARLGRVEPALVWAIMREESSFRPDVMSSAGAMGLLQLMPETARRQASRVGAGPVDDAALLEPETNILLGSAYLDYLAGRFPDRLSATIGSYNAGPNAVARWLHGEAARWDDDVWVEEIPYTQTRSYVKRVLRSLHVYRTFYD